MRLLLLAGTTEARLIAGALAAARLPAIASLAGATRTPEPLALPTRIGGFGGAEGFERFLRANTITAVLDATHPFAVAISLRTAAICQAQGVPFVQFLRPAWTPDDGDRWTFLNTEADAARHIPADARVFLATGAQALDRFAGLCGRSVFVRVVDPPRAPFPWPNGHWVVGRPPFMLTQECDLFLRLGIDWLVVRNSGGSSSRVKLDAARELGLPVAMLRRPQQPEGPKVSTVSAAVAWARAHL
ncbi:MAG: cobalt-precorrin-6A reductase [Rhodobacteraceae bacterium]|jgi:precorrin-6A/cobalt-precorrin-6A reductase|nr:cobalt-precorrin-6A reductase [Paracoccaceae bacterium]